MRLKKPVRFAGAVLVLIAGSLVVAPGHGQSAEMLPDRATQRAEGTGSSASWDALKWAKMHLRQAEHRFAEMRLLAAEGRLDHAEAMARGYAESIRAAHSEIDRARRHGQDVDRILTEVRAATGRHTEVLADLLDTVPAQAVPGIRHAAEVSRQSGGISGQGSGTARVPRSERRFDDAQVPAREAPDRSHFKMDRDRRFNTGAIPKGDAGQAAEIRVRGSSPDRR
jgi:hypothetical protein